MNVLNLQKKSCILKLNKKQNLRKVAKLLYISLETPDDVEKHVQSNSSDNCIHLHNVEILDLFDPELQLNLSFLY